MRNNGVSGVTANTYTGGTVVAGGDLLVESRRTLGTGGVKVLFGTTRIGDLAALAARDDAIGSFLRELASATDTPDEKAALRSALADVRGALPPELLVGDDAVDPHEPGLLDRLVAEARDMVLARITRQEAAK